MDQSSLEHINQLLDNEVDVKEKIKEQVTVLDKLARTIVGTLNKIHSTPSKDIPKLLETVSPNLQQCADVAAAIADLVPENEFWRYKGMWTDSIRSVVFGAALVEYLDTGALISLKGVTELVGIKNEWSTRLQLPAEDYLHGLISMVNELSRYAVNAVTMGDYELPIKVSAFVKDIFAGFSMLNLKNDILRRRFDSLKYDIKKIEEVVYDVSLRKLAAPEVEKAQNVATG